ncbi:MAG: radical SAM family heme chaperone HemW [Roseburia faecis]|jgi:putative oxygen-independent coproporphyrinogen III oxidase
MLLNENFYKTRESICISHYPCLTHTVSPVDTEKLMDLNSKNFVNAVEGSVYIHIPFCEKICKFCPFNKFIKEDNKVLKYLECLHKEIDLYTSTKYVQDTQFKCIAFGGGTPTCLSADQLGELISYIRNKFKFDREPEISIEGTPESCDFNKLEQLAAYGVNRISFGIQTFNERLSNVLELHHTIKQGIDAINNAHRVGINNVGIDLMYNIPGQTKEEFIEDIEVAYKLGVEHITLFSMNIPPKTKIGKEIAEGKLPNIGTLSKEIELYSSAEYKLQSLGYIQYSVYDFAKANKINLHAMNYFANQRNLIGIGAAAFGYINDFMYINSGNLMEYEKMILDKKLPVLYGEKATETDKKHGMLVKGFRMLDISKINYYTKFSSSVTEDFQEEITELKRAGLLTENEYTLSLTKKGRIYGNNICQLFIQDKFKSNKIIRHMLTKGLKPEEF